MKRLWMIAVAVAVGPTISIQATRIPRPQPTPRPTRISLRIGAAVAEAQTPTLTPATGSCCIVHGTAGCDDAACQNSVCASDPAPCALFGSSGTWDFQATLEAGTLDQCLAQGVPADACNSLTFSDCACAQTSPTPTPSITVTPGGPPTITPLPQNYCCQRDVPQACGPPAVGVNCGVNTPVANAGCDGSTGLCVQLTPIPGMVQVIEDTPVPSTATATRTLTPTSTPTVTVTGTPPTATPTPTSSRQDCCECPNACSVPPVNGNCPQGCTLVPNACCDCGGGGERPANTATPGGSTAAPRPSTTPTAVRGQ